MGILTLVAFLYGRRKHAIYALILSMILISFFWPAWLKTTSLQLSYGATLGIILFGQVRQNKPNNWIEKFLDYTAKEVRLSLAAQLFTAPLIFFYFRQISLVAPLSNLFVSFLIPPLMIFGFLTAFLGKIDLSLGLIPSYICYGLLSYMVFIIESFSKLPFVYFKF